MHVKSRRFPSDVYAIGCALLPFWLVNSPRARGGTFMFKKVTDRQKLA